MPLGCGQINAFGKKADLVAHTGAACMGYAQADLHRLRKRECRKVIAVRFGDKTDGGTAMNIERPTLN